MPALYAVVDVETTGSRPGVSEITEIGIVLTDGTEILQTWSSLVRPAAPIPSDIIALTGITNEMVQSAPPFARLADEVNSLLKDKVFVAHHVHFDYGFIKQSLATCGIQWEAEKVCTSRLFKNLFQSEKSSLAWICKQLGIENKQPHRALPDALATARAFIMMLNHYRRVTGKDFSTGVFRLLCKHPISGHLPESTGVYYLKDEQGKVLYVGKAVNIKKRIHQHLRDPEKSRLTAKVSYTETHSQWLALLVEDSEIQRLWPPLNSAQRRPPKHWGIIHYADAYGNIRFGIKALKNKHTSLVYFQTYRQAQECLLRLMTEYSLHPSLCGASTEPVKYYDPLHNQSAEKAICDLTSIKTFYSQFTGWLQLKDHTWQGNVFLAFIEGILIGYSITLNNHPDRENLCRLQTGINTPYILRSLFSQTSSSDFINDPLLIQTFEHQEYPLLRFC